MPRERVVRRTTTYHSPTVTRHPCPRCGNTIGVGYVATVYDRYGASCAWHGRCFDEAQKLAVAKAVVPSIPRTAGGREWERDDNVYGAANDALMRLGAVASERLMARAYAEGGDDLTAVRAVMLAAEIAKRAQLERSHH